MRCPPPCYQFNRTFLAVFPELSPAQRLGLALWVYGALLARSACQSAVIAALWMLGPSATVRQRLREWLYDGTERAAPCATQLEVATCFAPLLRWIVRLWQGNQLVLALDATAHGDTVVAVVIRVLYRQCAIPVAWAILPANQPGAWRPAELCLFSALRNVVPADWTVLVVTDRGLWSPALWQRIRGLGWHPLMRVRRETTFAPAGGMRQAAQRFVPGPGHAWVGTGVAFKHRRVRRRGTLLVVWGAGQDEPWILLTDLPPTQVGVAWYGLRVWIECGFRVLKRLGLHWQNTRRTDPSRIARHWLVLAVTTLIVLLYGTRVEDAAALGLSPAQLRAPRDILLPPRTVSLFRQGVTRLQWLLPQHRVWKGLWLRPEPWPEPLPGLPLIVHPDCPVPRPADPSPACMRSPLHCPNITSPCEPSWERGRG
jgi:hypothetical protein